MMVPVNNKLQMKIRVKRRTKMDLTISAPIIAALFVVKTMSLNFDRYIYYLTTK